MRVWFYFTTYVVRDNPIKNLTILLDNGSDIIQDLYYFSSLHVGNPYATHKKMNVYKVSHEISSSRISL